uniref:Acetylcholinesterase n=1 Tax=Strongyloides venezuelensis TaxID=75913 RepID=A0A0K0FXB7_STRVS
MIQMISIILLLFYVYVCTICAKSIVKTKNGPVSGKTIELFNTKVTEYLGIPFAKPPIGDLRFKSPQPLDEPAWHETFNADKPANACLQGVNMKGFEGMDFFVKKKEQSEDCLQLNMWVPQKPNGAVLVFIFGGGFRFGSPSLDIYNGSVLAAKTRTIVVNLNYRLGIFGLAYMCCGTDVQGNMALLDQQMGMRWVFRNIKSFKGDPNRITLWGHGAGSASATAHLYAKQSHKYFKRIIAGSGVITNIWARNYPQRVDDSVRIGSFAYGCQRNHHDIYECLKKLNDSDLLSISEKFSKQSDAPFTYGINIVTKDNVFFQGNIEEKIETKNMKTDVDIMIGMTSNEGSFFLPTLKDHELFGCAKNDSILFQYKEKTCKMKKKDFNLFYKYFTNTLNCNITETEILKRFYYQKDCIKDYRKCALKFLADVAFDCDILQFARMCAFKIDGYIYFYILDVTSSLLKFPKWVKSVHGAEIEYAFGLPFRQPRLYDKKLLTKAKRFSDKLMKIIGRFAKSGKPGYKWNKFNPYNMKAAKLDFSIIWKKKIKHIKKSITTRCKMINKYTSKYITH